mmetsp:Transcript_62270/g.144889  ORF Transcript_62270/g.144889 Transcript_62270/m.144889 type:complete len:394 (-) Transcript_62270:137-1318(-)
MVAAPMETILQELNRSIDDLRIENQALRRCLESSGLLTSREFELTRHRVRLEWSEQRHQGDSKAYPEVMWELGTGISACCDEVTLMRMAVACSAWLSFVSALSRIFLVGGVFVQAGKPIEVFDTVECLDVVSGTWEPQGGSVPRMRTRSASTVAAGKLYVLGGLAGNQAQDAVECLDLLTGIWGSHLPRLLAPRAACAAAAARGHLYVLGGSSDGRQILSTTEQLNLQTMSWSRAPPSHRPRGAPGAAALLWNIYLVGGYECKQPSASCECFDVESQVWHEMAPMRHPRADLAVAAAGGRIFAIGGFANAHAVLGAVESFVPAVGTWEACAPLLVPAAGCAAAVAQGRIYVFGGSDGRHSLNKVQFLLPEATVWQAGPRMTKRCMGLAVGASC